MKTAYWQKLRDPRWQRRRLEIMNLASFECQECGAPDKTLNVHHKIYRKNADPWNYTDEELQCLCEECHERIHDWKTLLNEALVRCGSIELEFIVGYTEAISWFTFGPSPVAKLKVRSAEHASGIAAAFGGIDDNEIIEVAITDKDRSIVVEKLFEMFEAKRAKQRNP